MAELSLAVSGKQIHFHFHYTFLARQIPTCEQRGYITHITKPRYDSTPSPCSPTHSSSRGGMSASCPSASCPCHAPAAPEGYPTSCLVGTQGVVLVVHQAGYWAKSRRDGGGGKSPSFIHKVSVHNPGHISTRSQPTALPCQWQQVLLPSHSGGKMVLLVAIIKTGRGRHLLFSATAEIALLAQTFWSWIILKCLCKDHQQVSPTRLALSLLQL